MCWASTEPGLKVVDGLDPARYRRHALHGEDRTWPETNCYTDLAIELAHVFGHEPRACLPFTLAIDCEGDQWTFFKPPLGELRELYGFDVQELAIWRPFLEHVLERLEAGHLVLVEVDSFHLPDTAGASYRATHGKTTIGINAVDVAGRRMGYFHNAGYFALEGEDFDAIFPRAGTPQERVLPPYAEFVKLAPGFVPPRGPALVEASLALATRHLARAPRSNPFVRYRERFARDLDSLMGADISHFHAYSFATLRQFGACYELAAANLQWLGTGGVDGLGEAAGALNAIAAQAKAFQFRLARATTRAKAPDTEPLVAMDALWRRAFDSLHDRLR